MPKRLAYRLTTEAYTPQAEDRIWWAPGGRVRQYVPGDGSVPNVTVEEVQGNGVWIRIPEAFKR